MLFKTRDNNNLNVLIKFFFLVNYFYICDMEQKNKLKIYSLEKQVVTLQERVTELENEIFRLLCVSKNLNKRQPSKKNELSEALVYLKQKKHKTLKDKESIYTLEVLLKNMS